MIGLAIMQTATEALPMGGIPTDLPGRQKAVAIGLAIVVLIVVIELVRQRKLREEYSFLWIITATALLVLALNYEILVWMTHLIGAVTPHSTLFFGGLVFLMIFSLQSSVRMSRLTHRLRKLSQRYADLENEVREIRKDLGGKNHEEES